MPEDPDKTCYIDQGPASAPQSTVDNDVIQNQPDITKYQPPPGSPINPPPIVDDDPTEPPPIGGPDAPPLPEDEHSAGGIHLPANYPLQDYRITEVLGQGGFGITYSAYDLLFDRKVVIKENLPAALSHRDSKTRCVQPLTEGTGPGSYAWALRNFLNEARILSKLEHPNIIKVITAFSALGTAYYVMPYVSGTSLNKASVPMPELEILPMLSDLLDALEYLHSKKLLHRDIKPANILRSQNGTPILIDFGTARVLTEHSQTTVESPGYTPFEQMQSHGNLGPWTDLYALGATMYYLITHTKPMKSADRVGRDDKHIPLAGRPELQKDYSPQLLLSVDKAMALWPEDRWQSAAEWRQALFPSPADPPEAEPSDIIDGESLLLQAAIEGRAGLVGRLLERGVNIEAADDSGETALMKATFANRVELTRLLLEHGADVNTEDESGETALMKAAYRGHAEIAALLLDAGADTAARSRLLGDTALHKAAYFGRPELVYLLLDRGADIEAKNSLGETALHQAAFGGELEVVKLLLRYGAKLDARDKWGVTALMAAAQEGHDEVVNLLLHHIRKNEEPNDME